MLSAVKDIEKAITLLPIDQLKDFRTWYEKFDSNRWDEQIMKDVATGKLDALADAAIADHKLGKSKEL